MSTTQRRKVVRHIVTELPLDAKPRSIEVLLSEVAIAVLGMSGDFAAEFAELHKDKALLELSQVIAEADERTEFCRVALNSSTPDLVQGSSFVQNNDDDAIRQAKERRLYHDAFTQFLRDLTWSEFEACSRGILHELGCMQPKLTRLSNDQGIDFFGHLPLRGRLGNESTLPSIDSRLNVWMVGQAKHYQKTQVSTPDLRELVGSVELAKAGAFADGGAALKGLEMKVCDPVFYLFFTTGTISRDGRKLLDESGMISMNGSQVATFLADNKVGVVDGTFDEVAARGWIASHS